VRSAGHELDALGPLAKEYPISASRDFKVADAVAGEADGNQLKH
jgi:hypothetical protein